MIKASQLLIAGFGGQGVQFCGKFLAHVGIKEDREVSYLSSYGPEVRGGTSNCSVIISDEPVGSPIVTDPEILSAIRSHTTGRAGMTALEQIVYIADFIEPGRPDLPGIEAVRDAAFQDLDLACYLYAKRLVEYLSETDRAVDPATAETMRYYREKLNLKD